MLKTIRWSTELCDAEGLVLPPAGKSDNQLKLGELKMAAQLIEDMTTPWRSRTYTHTFTTEIEELIKQKATAGEALEVTPLESLDGQDNASNVVDLTELLVRSLSGEKTACVKVKQVNTAGTKPNRNKNPIAKTGVSSNKRA